MSDLGVCTVCEEVPATTVWFAPVCQPCAKWLGALDAELQVEETFDPDLAEKGRLVDESAQRYYDAVRCRCVWLDERCPNVATQEDGLCDWCAVPGTRTDEQLRTNPNAVIGPDGEYLGLGGAGMLHDVGLADAKGYGPAKACWYDLDHRSVA